MKKLALIIGMILITTLGFSQRINGPKFKNKKTWENKKSSIVVTKEVDQIKGGKAKNTKTYEKEGEATPMVTRQRKRVFGGRAKNRRH